MLLLAMVWGLSIPVTKLGLITMPPLTLTALRFAVAIPCMILLLAGKKPLPWKALPAVAALGILGIGVGQVTQTFGVAGTSASIGTILSATIPLFIVLFAAIRLKQAVTLSQLLGVAAAFAGIVIVALENAGEAGADGTTALGPVWMLISAVAVAFYYVWSVELTNRYGTVVVATWSTVFGFAALLPWAGWEACHTSFELTGQAMAAAAYLGLAVTAAGLFLWLRILRDVPAPVAASVQYLQPVFGIAASAIMFGDRIGIQFMAGVVLILAGLATAVRAQRSK
ncbi:DMT family transporter [Azospirillum sp. 412522]|nr:DMT family transporter [Azospirillum sp. 412522]MBY6265737.1 DMT family transporter [Azospirillum sp. 412522]